MPSLNNNASPNQDELWSIAEHLCASEVRMIERAGSGANSRIYKIDTESEKYALKMFRPGKAEFNERLDAEAKALSFCNQNSIKVVPMLYDLNRENNCSLMEWIDGEAVKSTTVVDVASMISFLRHLHSSKNNPTAEQITTGTEACLSGEELKRQVLERANRLSEAASENEALSEFIEKEYHITIEAVSEWCELAYSKQDLSFSTDIDHSQQILSPVDFGFHNSLRRNTGELVFFDFEYFGWDDPVKLVADTLQHPGMVLSSAQKDCFFQGTLELFQTDKEYLTRLKILYPLYGLRWCAIMLNEFLPSYQRPSDEFLSERELTQLKMEKLERVSKITQSILSNYRQFPYSN